MGQSEWGDKTEFQFQCQCNMNSTDFCCESAFWLHIYNTNLHTYTCREYTHTQTHMKCIILKIVIELHFHYTFGRPKTVRTLFVCLMPTSTAEHIFHICEINAMECVHNLTDYYPDTMLSYSQCICMCSKYEKVYHEYIWGFLLEHCANHLHVNEMFKAYYITFVF